MICQLELKLLILYPNEGAKCTHVDQKLYADLNRTDEQTRPLEEQGAKARFSVYEKLLDGLKNIVEGLE